MTPREKLQFALDRLELAIDRVETRLQQDIDRDGLTGYVPDDMTIDGGIPILLPMRMALVEGLALLDRP